MTGTTLFAVGDRAIVDVEPGTAPIKRQDLETWSRQFEAPDAAELALFDQKRDG